MDSTLAPVEYRFATRKGAERAQRIVEAAYRCLARDGYAHTSMQRIAEEAGVQKRMLHYYFDTRERLFEEVVAYVGERLLRPVEAAIDGLEEPPEIVNFGFDRLWSELGAEPELQGVYLGLIAESLGDPSLRRATVALGDRYRHLIQRLIAEVKARGWTLRISEDTLVVAIIASVQGLAIQYLERGETPELARAAENFKRWMISMAEPPG